MHLVPFDQGNNRLPPSPGPLKKVLSILAKRSVVILKIIKTLILERSVNSIQCSFIRRVTLSILFVELGVHLNSSSEYEKVRAVSLPSLSIRKGRCM